MAKEDIPVFREARRGQVVRSEDWNGMQRELRNGLRGHRHTRVEGAPVDDGRPDDDALQITTDEVADATVSLVKLAPEVRERLDRGAQIATGLEELAAGGEKQVEHGLGAVPVAVFLGLLQSNVTGLEGEFEVYAGSSVPGTLVAAVPVEPDGTFFLVSRAETDVTLRWWATAQAAET